MRDDSPFILSFALASVLLIFSGCCTKNRCGTPPATIKIHDADGNRVPNAKAVSSDLEPVRCAMAVDCDYSFRVAMGTITISAAGYKPATVTIEPREDDCGNAVAQRVSVTLQSESDLAQSKALSVAGESCGH